jgi:hypothetical protein
VAQNPTTELALDTANLSDSPMRWSRSAGPPMKPQPETLTGDSLRPVVGPRVIGPSRASALAALLAELQEPAECLRKIVAGLRVYRLAP